MDQAVTMKPDILNAEKPFRMGPEILAEGGVRFNLIAPSAREVLLVIGQNDPIAMTASDPGLYSITVSDAGHGTRYNFLVDGTFIPDQASFFQPDGCDKQSEVIDFSKIVALDEFPGIAWEDSIFYQLHVGTFTREGTFAGVEAKLDYLKDLGVNSILMLPLNDMPGARDWGYNGTFWNALNSAYGTWDDFARLVNAAHARGMAVYQDVVYNHVGPEGNYRDLYHKGFFNHDHTTGWGTAPDMANPHVRQHILDNVLHWVVTMSLDGLRFDAVHAYRDNSPQPLLNALPAIVRSATRGRKVNLIDENYDNSAELVMLGFKQIGDDWRNSLWPALHNDVDQPLVRETERYLASFADRPLRHFARAATHLWSYMGETFPTEGKPRGTPSTGLSPVDILSFLQNHDQIGNRLPRGQRFASLVSDPVWHQGMTVLLLSPSVPQLFMGDEWGSERDWGYVTDQKEDAARATREGRVKEFLEGGGELTADQIASIPDPNDVRTFESFILDWKENEDPRKAWKMAISRTLAHTRAQVQNVIRHSFVDASHEVLLTSSGADGALNIHWSFGNGGRQKLQMVFSRASEPLPMPAWLDGELIYECNAGPDRNVLYPNQACVIVQHGPTSTPS